MSMRDRIAQGKLFTDYCEGLPEDRAEAKRKMKAFNLTGPDELEERMGLMKEIFGRDTGSWIEPPIYFCYGSNIELGRECYLNFNCNFVDDGKIVIGDRTMFGPGVTVATVGHPLNPDYRMYMYADPVIIGKNCWIGASATILPGVTIGDNSVIGAGSVVTSDIPANSIAVGNPCRVLREINDRDRKYYYRDREITREDLAEEAGFR